MERIDHVGLVVSDLQQSIDWYQEVLGMRRIEYPAWNNYPVMMQGGDSTVALFEKESPPKEIIKYFHFAFRVNREDYQSFKKSFDVRHIPYRESDHIYFHSIYLIDPDGYEVELTTEADQMA